MRSYLLDHVDDPTVLRRLHTFATRDGVNTAFYIAHIAAADARRLYAPAGYASMHAYCVAELGASEDVAFKLITAARAARRFPLIFDLVGHGRLHLTAVRMLAPHLTAENASRLLETACALPATRLERLIADLRTESSPPMLPVCGTSQEPEVVPAQEVDPDFGEQCSLAARRVAPAIDAVANRATDATPASTATAATSATTVWPEERVRLELAISRRTHDNLRYLRSLLSHSIPSGDLASVLDRAIRIAIQAVENRKFAATTRPRAAAPRRQAIRPRTIPAEVRRAVWRRDLGECTFVSENGRRCASRRFLEFDHVDPFARGGRTTVENTRLRCRTHNQYEAERTFGKAFMNARRQEKSRAQARGVTPAEASPSPGIRAAPASAPARRRSRRRGPGTPPRRPRVET